MGIFCYICEDFFFLSTTLMLKISLLAFCSLAFKTTYMYMYNVVDDDENHTWKLHSLHFVRTAIEWKEG